MIAGFRDLVALVWGWKARPRAAPPIVPVMVTEVLAAIYVGGAPAGEVRSGGAAAGEIRSGGAVAGQVAYD
jgi:hypothetical protein